MVLSTLIVGALLASPSLADFDEDDFRVSEPVLAGRPPEWPNNNFDLFDTCPGSGARAHTMAEMTIDFTNTCEEVMAEISARAGSAANGGNWVDPHNRGHYKVLATEGNLLKVQRYTGNYEYRDVQTFAMTASGTGCEVNACSVSQGNSNNDGGTNLCDMQNLFCNSATKNPDNGVTCKAVKNDLTYTMPYVECGRYQGNGRYLQHNCQDFETTCLKQPAMDNAAVVLGAPRDYRHDGFQKFATCARSGARQHTMAQMTIEFGNSCADVSAEIQARANGNDGWKDPHNRGTYTTLSTNGNLL